MSRTVVGELGVGESAEGIAATLAAPVKIGARYEIGDGQEVVFAHDRRAVLDVPAQRRVALDLDQRVGVGGVELDCGQGAHREGAATPPPVAAGFTEDREVEAVLCEEAMPYLYRQSARPSGVQASQVVRAARQGEQAKIELASFGSIGLAEGSVPAFGEAQTFAEMRIVDVLAATGQLSGTHFGFVIVLRPFRADHTLAGRSLAPAMRTPSQPLVSRLSRVLRGSTSAPPLAGRTRYNGSAVGVSVRSARM
ncbi:hypothetical protein [Streptomyces griseus]|uniref:hypothetical protein n=1 Tax=Streptomyces griseus TaxID=1911 RepID=UPI0033A03BC8